MIDAIILAGGLGSRLSHIVPDLPKALAPIQQTPFLEILLNKLKSEKLFSKIAIALGYKSEKLIEFLKKYPEVAYSIEPHPLGTGGAILFALPKTTSQTLLILNGDTFFDINLQDFYTFHKQKKNAATLAIRYEEESGRYGSVRIDPHQKIVQFEEKSPTIQKGWVSGGIYLIERELFSSFTLGSSYSMEKEFLPLFLQKGMFAYPSQSAFIDIGTEDSYKQAQHILQPWT